MSLARTNLTDFHLFQTGGLNAGPLTLLYLLILVISLALAGYILYRRRLSRRLLVNRLTELSVFADMGRFIVGAQLDLNRLAHLVYEQAGKIVDTSIFQLGLFDGESYRLLIWVVDGEPRPLAEFQLTPDSLGIVGWMRTSRQSLLVRDFENEADSLPARPRYISGDPPRSAVFVPLLVGENVLGAIAIQSRRPLAFTEEHLRLLTIVANHASAALENARLYEQAQHQADQLRQLSEISQRINAIQSLPLLYQQVVELAAEKFSDYAVSFFECHNGTITLAASTRPDWRGQTRTVPLGDGPIGQAAAERRAVLSQTWPVETRKHADNAAGAAPSPELSIPVEINNRVLGILNVQGRAGSVFDSNAVPIFKSLAAQMAIAILEGQLYEAERRRSEQLVALAQTSRAVVSTLELDDLLDEVLELVDEHFDYPRVHILFLQNNQLVFRAGIGDAAERWEVEGASFPLDGPGLVALAGRSLQPVRADDVSQHPDYLFTPFLADTRSEMSVPMVMADRLLGVFDVQSNRLAAFTEQDVQTLQTLADTLAVAVRNARLFEGERRRRRLAEILREVSTALTSTLHLDDVLNLILNGLARVVNYDTASILLVNEVGEVQLRATRGSLDAEAFIGLTLDVKLLPPGEPFPTVVPFSELDHHNEYHDLLALPDPHACLGAVLALRGEHLGYLVVDYAGHDQFPVEEAELISAFASQAAVAIENARLYTSQREQVWISTALLQVADATARATELKEIFETVARLTPMLVGVERCGLWQADGEQFVLQAYHAADVEVNSLSPHSVSPAEWPRLAELISTLEPVVLDSESELPESCRDLFVGIVILLPLMAKGRAEGVLMVGQTPGENPFTAHRIRLLSGIANQAALAIESALLDRAQQEEAWVSTALLQVAQAVAGQPTLAEGLETVARLTPMLVGIERVAIYQWDETIKRFRASQVMGMGLAATAELTHLTASAADLGLDAADPAARAFPVTLPEHLAHPLGTASVMVWPLWVRGDLLGALIVEEVQSLGRRLSILNGIAHQLGMAMENARLARDVAQQQRLERELEVGHDIQYSFLPKACPTIAGWQVCSYWHAARQVGGDFYDFIPLRMQGGQERWGIVIADVADKGVPAALFMALSRTLLRSVAIGRVSPAATLTRVNQLILADARTDLFVTVFYGVWEPASGRFRYANGGHNPPIWVDHAGEARTLKGRGLALGVLEDVEYEEHEVHFDPGDLLFLYTDGVTDAINTAEDEFGMKRLSEVVHRANRTGSASDIVAATATAVEQHVQGIEAFDDITMVVIKRAD